MENFSINLPGRVYHLVKERANLTGRSREEELVHAIMMWFDPEYAEREMARMIQEMTDLNEELYGEEADDLDDNTASEKAPVCSS